MKQIDRILVPIEINEYNTTFINTVKNIARKFESEIILLGNLKEGIQRKPYSNRIKLMLQERLEAIHNDFVYSNLKSKTPQILFGNTFDNIVNCSRIEKANVILVSSDFAKSDEKEKISSVCEKLVRKAECPVWIIKHDKELKLNNILCPVDFSNPSVRALQNAIQIAKTSNANLTVLSIIEPFLDLSFRNEVDLSKENEKHRVENLARINILLKEFNLKGVSHKIKVFVGQPSKAIINEIKNNDIDLLVIGTTGKTNLGKILVGSVTEKVIREMACSVITTKSTDIINLRLGNEIKDIEQLTQIAKELEKNGLVKEAIDQYDLCLRINDMHIPSYFRIVNLYNRLGQYDKAKEYKKLVSELISRLWDKRIEFEIEEHYLKKV